MPTAGSIVLVEDDEDDIFLIQTALNEMGMGNKLRVFRNGKDALEYFSAGDEMPLVVVSDVNMPVMNGLELLEELAKGQFFDRYITPFVFLTTSESSVALKNKLTDSLASFFVKGFSYEQIRETISSIVAYGNSRHSLAAAG